MKRQFLFLALLFFIFLSCNSNSNSQNTNQGSINENVFNEEKFGWVLKVPEGWRMTSNIEKHLLEKAGDKLIAEEFKENAANSWTEILNIQIAGSKINQLSASYTRFNPSKHGSSYERSKETRFFGVKKIIENKGGDVEAIRTTTTIDGLKFDTYNMSVTQQGEQKYYQILLEKKFDNEDILLINIFASERAKLEQFQDAILASSFKRRK